MIIRLVIGTKTVPNQQHLINVSFALHSYKLAEKVKF
jgi:hypothetical protein